MTTQLIITIGPDEHPTTVRVQWVDATNTNRCSYRLDQCPPEIADAVRNAVANVPSRIAECFTRFETYP